MLATNRYMFSAKIGVQPNVIGRRKLCLQARDNLVQITRDKIARPSFHQVLSCITVLSHMFGNMSAQALGTS